MDPSLTDGKGTSLVLANTLRGAIAMEELRGEMTLWREIPLEATQRRNGRLVRPARKAPGRMLFFNELGRLGFHIAVAKAMEVKEAKGTKKER